MKCDIESRPAVTTLTSTESSSLLTSSSDRAGKIVIHYNEGPPGCGKSRFLQTQVVQQKARYLYAVPTTRLLHEVHETIEGIARDAGTAMPPVVPVTSKTPGVGKVSRRLTEVAQSVPSESHCIILCTHEGLMSADLTAFAGWTLFIDEVPTVIEGGVFRTPHSAVALSDLYRLEPVTADWSMVRPINEELSATALSSDMLLRPLTRLQRRIRETGRPVYVDLVNWRDVKNREAWSWWSLWEIGKVAPFAEVRMVGSALGSSLTKQIIDRWTRSEDDVEFRKFELPSTPPRVKRSVTVHYFTDKPGNTVFWSTENGRTCIAAIANWLKHNAPADELLWSGNDCVITQWRAVGLAGQQESPILAGVNAYRTKTWAAIMFSGKMLPSERESLRLFEPDVDAVRRSREFETILQFAFRTALREPQFSGEVHVVVYDRSQAEFLAAFLQDNELAEAQIRYEDIGISKLTSRRERTSETTEERYGQGVRTPPVPAKQRAAEYRARRKLGPEVTAPKKGRPRRR